MSAGVVIVGAGFSGAVVARELAEEGIATRVLDSRSHVAGNAHTERDATGVMVHAYGPHIFHTNHRHVWDYVNRWAVMRPYNHRVKATARGRVYSLPVNLLTINQFFGTTMGPAEAEAFIAARADASIGEPVSFTDQALKFVGRELYEAFFEGYTRKQWGIEPEALPASVLARLPVRFTYEDSYFAHPWQAIPERGYTAMVEAILDHPLIEVTLSHRVDPGGLDGAEHVFWSGPIDEWFGHEDGRLGYRTLDFESRTVEGDHQGCPVMNYCDAEIPWTRVTEHKHFAPWEAHAGSVIFTEYSRQCGPDDIPYYPIRLVEEKVQLLRYAERARESTGVTFLGRLGTYRYLDMDVTIAEALDVARTYLARRAAGDKMPSFVTDPLG